MPATRENIIKTFLDSARTPEDADMLLSKTSWNSLLDDAQQSEDDGGAIRALMALIEIPRMRHDILKNSKSLENHFKQLSAAGCTSCRRFVVKFLSSLELHVTQQDDVGERALELRLFDHLGTFLGDADVGVAHEASVALEKLAKQEKDFSRIDLASIWDVYRRLGAKDEIVKIRIFDVSIEMSKINKSVFEQCKEFGLFSDLVSDYKTDDLLLKLNIVRLIAELASIPQGAAIVSELCGVDEVLRSLEDLAVDPLARGEAMKVAAHIACAQEGSAMSTVMSSLFTHLDEVFPRTLNEYMECHGEPSLQIAAIDAWLSLAATKEGVRLLREHQQTKESFGQMLELLDDSRDQPIYLGALKSWGVFATTAAADPDLTSWAEPLVANSAIPKIARILKERPFPVARVNTYSALRGCVEFRAAALEICSSDSSRRILADFNSEETHESRIAKNDFVRKLLELHEDFLRNIIGQAFFGILLIQRDKGPFYAPADVRLEDSAS